MSPEILKKLQVNDVIYVTGKIFTARDSAHMKMRGMKPTDLPFDPSVMGLYHCGPLMKKEDGRWIVVSASRRRAAAWRSLKTSFLIASDFISLSEKAV